MLMNLPPEKKALLDRILSLLAPIPGVQAVVLGGSYARGTACLWYFPENRKDKEGGRHTGFFFR